jgi:hypothetical protein
MGTHMWVAWSCESYEPHILIYVDHDVTTSQIFVPIGELEPKFKGANSCVWFSFIQGYKKEKICMECLSLKKSCWNNYIRSQMSLELVCLINQ